MEGKLEEKENKTQREHVQKCLILAGGSDYSVRQVYMFLCASVFNWKVHWNSPFSFTPMSCISMEDSGAISALGSASEALHP
jgi:hypothetical protein